MCTGVPYMCTGVPYMWYGNPLHVVRMTGTPVLTVLTAFRR
jgi:hypothetical protein